MFTSDVALKPSAGEMYNRHEKEVELMRDLFKNPKAMHSMPPNQPVRVIPILTIDHIRSIEESQGLISVAATFTFTWMDDRLQWEPEKYGGIRALSLLDVEDSVGDIWTPIIHMTDLPEGRKQSDLFMSRDFNGIITYTGTVKAAMKTIVTTPCYFGFGEYPNDYQNCSFTLLAPYFGNEFQFANWGGAELTRFLTSEEKVADVGDFRLIDLDSQGYFMFLGIKVVEDITKYNIHHCRSYFRYNLMLKRENKLVFAQLSVPMIVACVIVAMSAIIPNKYGLIILMFSVLYQTFNALTMSEIMPDDYNGMPMISVLAVVLMFETLLLIGWRVYSLHIRTIKGLGRLTDPLRYTEFRQSVTLDAVIAADGALSIILFLQCIGHIYIILKN
ncbi:unnamed protein product [Caenorhabditis sp. 36 PRJEB53466]|nr:unnamed protein product [Caenorhabditis sp. 36 PRJEB53466]